MGGIPKEDRSRVRKEGLNWFQRTSVGRIR